MKVIVRKSDLEKNFEVKENPKKRANPLRLNGNKTYKVKKIGHDVYGSYYKLFGIQLPFNTQWFFVSDIGIDTVYAQVNVYVIVELNPKKIPKDTLNPSKDLELRHHYKVKRAFYDRCGWMFELEGIEKPVLQKYMDVTRMN